MALEDSSEGLKMEMPVEKDQVHHLKGHNSSTSTINEKDQVHHHRDV